MHLNKYHTNKNKYITLININSFAKSTINCSHNINHVIQSGGGAWSMYSDGNDYTHDLLFEYKIFTFDKKDDRLIYNRDLQSTNKSLKKLFMDHKIIQNENENENENKNKKDYTLGILYPILGVIIYMLLEKYNINIKYVKYALIFAYKQYINICAIREASGWFGWETRKECLIDEIRLLNYVINNAKDNICLFHYKYDSSDDSCDDFHKIISTIHEKNPSKTMDFIFMQYRKIIPKYTFQKYNVQPAIDPKILNCGIVMMGYEARKDERHIFNNKYTNNLLIGFIVKGVHSYDYFGIKNDNKWSLYDYNDYKASYLIDHDIFVDIYGDEYLKMMKFKN